MSNPIILYDNRFEDGDLSATNTATGYDVNNIKDLRTHTFWKANAAGTLYITEAPLLKDSLDQEEMRIVPADGYAKVYLPSSLDLTDYLGDRIVCLDSALKKHIGYLKSIDSDNGVNVIANSGVGITGIYVADDADLDMDTNNFTPVRKVALPDWTPAAISVLMRKQVLASDDGWIFGVRTDGKLYVVLVRDSIATTFYSTAATGFTDGTEHTVGASITRETASAAGSIVFVADGVQLGTSVAITAADTRSLSNSSPLYVAGGENAQYASINKKAYLYNRALTVPEHLSLYQTGEVAAGDQWGSQTAKDSDTEWTGASGATPPTGWSWTSAPATGVCSIFDSGDGAPYDKSLKIEHNGVNNNPSMYKVYYTDIGKKYRLSGYFKKGTATSGRIQAGTAAGSYANYGIASSITDATWTKYSFEFTATDTSFRLYLYNYTTTSGQYSLYDEFFLYEIGACLDLNESNIGDTSWTDASTNGNDASYPASGSAVVLGNNIVSTPDGSTYNWESKETGFNHADAAGYAYKISEADTVDALGIEGHNLGTAGAAVSVESTDDESTWTERLAAFNPSDDTAILKTMTSFRAASKRLKIVTASVAPYIACALLGDRLDFNRGAYIGDGPIVPWQFGIVAAAQRSKTGNLLGNTIRYKPVDISITIPTDTYDWFNAYFWPFWRDHGSELKPFFFAPDLTTFADKIFWVQLTEDSVLAPPMLVKDRVDRYTFTIRGVLET